MSAENGIRPAPGHARWAKSHCDKKPAALPQPSHEASLPCSISRIFQHGVGRLLRNARKHFANFPVERSKVHRHYAFPGMQHYVHSRRQYPNMPANSLTHAPLNPVALHSLAHHASGCQPHSRRSIRSTLRLQRKKIRHRRRKLLPAAGVNTLIIAVPTQPKITPDAQRGMLGSAFGCMRHRFLNAGKKAAIPVEPLPSRIRERV